MSYNLPYWYYIIFNVKHCETILTLWITHSFCIWILLRLNLLVFYFPLYIYFYCLFFIRYTYFLLLYNLSSDRAISRSKILFYLWLTKNKYYPSSSFLSYKNINFFPGFKRCVIDRIQYTVTHKSLRTFYKRFLRKSISSKRSTLERRTTTTFCRTDAPLIFLHAKQW